jgi:PleD family two-component response regulator
MIDRGAAAADERLPPRGLSKRPNGRVGGLMPNRERILIVEDDADTREALFTLVTNRGYSALTADNGQQALDLLERGIRPKLILIDLMMPKVNGQDLIDHLALDAGVENDSDDRHHGHAEGASSGHR